MKLPGRTRRLLGATKAPVLPDVDFDATYGYDLAHLLRIGAPEPPADYDDFWQHLAEAAAGVEFAPVATGQRVLHAARDWYLSDLTYTAVDGIRIGGWLAQPAHGQVERGFVVGHGYGGRDDVTPADLDVLPDRCAAVFPCARGMSRSLVPGIGDVSERHVLSGIGSRDTYAHRGCVADQWCAAHALHALAPGTAERTDYLGVSFGGGIGAMALAHAGVFASGVLVVPSFGAHPLRLQMPCTGSGEAVRRYAADHPDVVELLRYFDAAVAATRIDVPTLVAPALADPSVPPPGQFAVANAVAGPTTTYVLPAGHAEYAGAAEADLELAEHIRAFWG